MALAILVVILLFYFMLKICANRCKCCRSLIQLLKKKMFYNVWIRYIIESNLKMTHSCIFFLYISGQFDSVSAVLNSVIRIVIITIYSIWPFFAAGFLWYHKGKLTDTSFK